MEHKHYTYSPQFNRILAAWETSIGKENYYTIETYKQSPTCFALYNITYPSGIRETDTVLHFKIRCPHCNTTHTCHVPDQSPEVEHLAQYYTTCTRCKEIFHLLSNFINEETPTAPHTLPSTNSTKKKADILAGILILIIFIAAEIITAPYAGKPFGSNLTINILRYIAGIYLASNILHFFGVIIGLNYGHYAAPKSWTMRCLLAPSCLFWYSPLIIYHTIKHLHTTFKQHPIKHILKPFPLIISLLLLIALCKLPYGYYQFLRLAVTAWGCITIYTSLHQHPANKHLNTINLIAGSIAILYNPIIPVEFKKNTWQILNLLSIPAILTATYFSQLPSTPHRQITANPQPN